MGSMGTWGDGSGAGRPGLGVPARGGPGSGWGAGSPDATFRAWPTIQAGVGVRMCLVAAWTKCCHIGYWVWVGRSGLESAWGTADGASDSEGTGFGERPGAGWALRPRLRGSGGVRPSSYGPSLLLARTFPRRPGACFPPAANWCVGGAAAPGMLGTRGADSGAPATLGHRVRQHRLQRGSECDACACHTCSRELRRPEEHCKFQASLGYKTAFSKQVLGFNR